MVPEERVVKLLESFKGEHTLLVITHRPALLAPADQVLELSASEVLLELKLLAA